MYSACCKILGVNPNSSLDDVKRAYRQKAKVLHPDINSSPDAHTEFIKTKQAFEFIQRYMTCQALYRKRYSYYRERSMTRPKYRGYYRYEDVKYRASKYRARKMYHSAKTDIDFKSTLFGKIVFIVFHLMFLFVGFYTLLYPLIHTIKYGVDQEKTLIGTIITIACAMMFGSAMVFMIAISGLSFNSKNKYF
ncbi:MAG: J domain-containing protein [Bacteroidales bacterium]|nr:MAG: J domain-containing protein [Bacteroidales bacterium]